ncbi:tyrosine recombinase XerC [Lachnospiraceae bacterium]|jgi:Site-specific recombinase XerD|nr:tyrosine recombinase XerC [Lachnospiraceae bacterium]
MELNNLQCGQYAQSNDILQFIINNGMIDISDVQNSMEAMKRKELLDKHPYKIWQGKDGKWYTYLPDDKKGRRLLKRNSEKEIELCVIDYIKQNSEENIVKNIASKMTLQSIFPKWLEYKQIHTNSTSYIKRITADWHRFYVEQQEFINMPLQKMTFVILDEWAHSMIKQYKLTKKSYYNMSLILRQCLDYAVECGYISENVFSKVKVNTKLFQRVKKKTGESQVYTIDEEERFIKDMIRRFQNHPENTAPLAVMLAFETGVRIGELCVLKFEDIEGNYIHIQRQEIREFQKVDEYNMKFKCYRVVEYTKSEDGFRHIYLTAAARKIIELARYMNNVNGEYCEEGYIFVHNHKNINHYSIQAMILRGCKKVNMDVKTSHKIRKTYISTLIDSGLNIDAIRRFAGHSDERTTYGNYCYNRMTDKQTEEIVENALGMNEVIKGNHFLEAIM